MQYYAILSELVSMLELNDITADAFKEAMLYLIEYKDKLVKYEGFIKEVDESFIIKFIDKDQDTMGYTVICNNSYKEPSYTIQEILQLAKDKDTKISFYRIIKNGKLKYTTDGYAIFSEDLKDFIDKELYDKYRLTKLKFYLE